MSILTRIASPSVIAAGMMGMTSFGALAADLDKAYGALPAPEVIAAPAYVPNTGAVVDMYCPTSQKKNGMPVWERLPASFVLANVKTMKGCLSAPPAGVVVVTPTSSKFAPIFTQYQPAGAVDLSYPRQLNWGADIGVSLALGGLAGVAEAFLNKDHKITYTFVPGTPGQTTTTTINTSTTVEKSWSSYVKVTEFSSREHKQTTSFTVPQITPALCPGACGTTALDSQIANAKVGQKTYFTGVAIKDGTIGNSAVTNNQGITTSGWFIKKADGSVVFDSATTREINASLKGDSTQGVGRTRTVSAADLPKLLANDNTGVLRVQSLTVGVPTSVSVTKYDANGKPEKQVSVIATLNKDGSVTFQGSKADKLSTLFKGESLGAGTGMSGKWKSGTSMTGKGSGSWGNSMPNGQGNNGGGKPNMGNWTPTQGGTHEVQAHAGSHDSHNGGKVVSTHKSGSSSSTVYSSITTSTATPGTPGYTIAHQSTRINWGRAALTGVAAAGVTFGTTVALDSIADIWSPTRWYKPTYNLGVYSNN